MVQFLVVLLVQSMKSLLVPRSRDSIHARIFNENLPVKKIIDINKLEIAEIGCNDGGLTTKTF